ncbi:MAG: tRNA (adenosine(37)-N6)-threonylcarbamoyltransferase complex ATPase subunit type 1 TsaE [Polyangiales bacterium]
MFEHTLEAEQATLELAAAVGRVLAPGDLVGLEGGLGAGKTTFVRGAVRGLGVPESIAVTSPTFALMHDYVGRFPIVHADFYRLAAAAELDELGFGELLESQTVLFVEWGRKFPSFAERATLWIDLEIVSDEARRVRVRPCGERGDAIAAALRPIFT